MEAFLREWDPIGVIPTLLKDGLPPNEYDSYAPQVHQMLADGCSAESIALSLGLIRTQSMGLPSLPASDLAVARRMVAWWTFRDKLVSSPT